MKTDDSDMDDGVGKTKDSLDRILNSLPDKSRPLGIEDVPPQFPTYLANPLLVGLILPGYETGLTRRHLVSQLQELLQASHELPERYPVLHQLKAAVDAETRALAAPAVSLPRPAVPPVPVGTEGVDTIDLF